MSRGRVFVTTAAKRETMVVVITLVQDAWLWGWEIWESPGGRLVESSWAATWSAYPSRQEAEAAGRQRLPRVGCTWRLTWTRWFPA